MRLNGNLLGNLLGKLLGTGAPPVAATVSVTVRATRRGWFGTGLIEVGTRFAITAPEQFSPYWMEWVDAIPPTWSSYLATYSAQTDEELLDPPTAAEVVTQLGRTGGFYTKVR